MQITPELINRINELLSHGLTKGLGSPEPGKMCVEAAICFALGEPHSDEPSCVGKGIRGPKIILNDFNWPSDKARAEGMKYLAVAQLGSVELDQDEFKQKLRLNSTKRLLPFIIQKHYEHTKDEKLLEYKTKFESLVKSDDKLWTEFYYKYHNYYQYYYYYYYNYYDCTYYTYYHYYYNCYGIEWLHLIADVILQTLKEMNCEGCKWLHLVK